MTNNDEKIIVKQPKVSAFTSFYFKDLKKGVFFATEICRISFSLVVFTLTIMPFAENINN